IAGKTGTTQNNTDGWFILMHPDLVAGAWVGFNDARVTMRSNYWGQGGHNAVLLVGDFYRSALNARLIDAKALFPGGKLPPAPVIVEQIIEPAEPAVEPAPEDWMEQLRTLPERRDLPSQSMPEPIPDAGRSNDQPFIYKSAPSVTGEPPQEALPGQY
ncbi:MAG: penicillin-binding protein, partial [bacterium]